MKPQYLKTVKELIDRGMRRDRALACVYKAFALTPDELARLDHATRTAA